MLPENYRLGGLATTNIYTYFGDFLASSQEEKYEKDLNNAVVHQEEIIKNTEDSSQDMEGKKDFEEEKINSHILSLK